MKRFLVVTCILCTGSLARAQSAPPLGSAQSFAVLASTSVTNAGPTVITGDLGVSPGTTITGFPPGTVTGGTIHAGDAFAAAGQTDATTAYDDLVAEPCGTDLTGQILGTSPGPVTLTPGVYCFTGSAQLTGSLTLSGSGVYVFQISGNLTTSATSSVALANGATVGNVFWQVGGSATIANSNTLVGSFIVLDGATVNVHTSIAGRLISLSGSVSLKSDRITSNGASIAGRWEIVHTSGDSSTQTALYPGSFSTYLNADGTSYAFGTFTESLCVIDAETNNIVPTWTATGGNNYQITVTVNNLKLGPNFAFIYRGTLEPATPVPGDTSILIPAISGTYYATGNVTACSTTTRSSPGNFVATFLPTLSSGTTSGALDGFTAANGSPFDNTVNTTITFSAPPTPGQIAGTVSFDSIPTFNRAACFASTGGVVNPLTITSGVSRQSGVVEYMFAQGFDPNGVPTTLFLNGFSADLYAANPNTDQNAVQLSATGWAVEAAIGEDNPSAAPDGVSNDGTNTAIVLQYGVEGGACDGVGGIDAPFQLRTHIKYRRQN